MNWKTAIAITVMLGSTACYEEQSTEPTREVPGDPAQNALAAAARGSNDRGTEDDILRLENFLPGLGGVYVENGETVLYVLPGTSDVAISDALSRGAAALNIPEEMRSRLAHRQNVRIKTGKFAFSQLVAWQDVVGAAVMGIPGVVGVDADERTNSVAVIVQSSDMAIRIAGVVKKLGLPENAVYVVQQGGPVSTATLRDTIRPAGGGMQIARGFNNYCTMGFNVPIGDDIKGFWTAGHCSPGLLGDGTTGGVIYQAEGAASQRIGTVLINPEWNVLSPNCAVPRCTQVDAMYVEFDSSQNYSSRVARMTGLANYGFSHLVYGTRDGWFTNVNLSLSSSWVGMDVDKVGRTTGWSRGDLNRTCVHITVNSATANAYTVLCSDEVKGAYAGRGDSGAPVFIGHDDSDSQLNALGIQFAANFAAGYDTDEEGNQYCNNSNCLYYFNRLSRLYLFLTIPY